MDQLVAALRDSLAQDQARLDAASLYFSSLSAGAAPWLLEALLALVSVPELEAAVRQQAGLQLRRLLQCTVCRFNCRRCRGMAAGQYLRLEGQARSKSAASRLTDA